MTDRLIAGRSSLGALIYEQWDVVVSAVESLPTKAREQGAERALAYAKAQLHAFVDSVALTIPKTPEAVEAAHRVHSALGEGQLRVMLRDDRAGERIRAEFLMVAERELLSHSIRAVFDRSKEELPEEAYVPDTRE